LSFPFPPAGGKEELGLAGGFLNGGACEKEGQSDYGFPKK